MKGSEGLCCRREAAGGRRWLLRPPAAPLLLEAARVCRRLWGCRLVPVPQGVLTSVLASWCRGLMPVRKAADKWLSLGENRVPTSTRQQADDLELDFLRHGSAPFGYGM